MSAPQPPRFVYVIVRDMGYDGKGAPAQATDTLDEAIALARLMSRIDTFLVFKVPVWPTADSEPWRDPVWPVNVAKP